MNEYKTSQEMADAWGVSAHTIQSLCRVGKVPGAMKRAGCWFIPGDAALPLNNTKAGASHGFFLGTKKRIFDNAMGLFARCGFENVTMKEIALSAGIMQSAIYNHFPSKQSLLATMYDYYQEHFNDNKVPFPALKKILHRRNKEAFMRAIMFTFETADEEKTRRMILLTKIVYMRFFQDERANSLFLDMMNAKEEEYILAILRYGMEAGLIAPFDAKSYARFLVGQRHIMGIKAFASPEYSPAQLEEERDILRICGEMLPLIG